MLAGRIDAAVQLSNQVPVLLARGQPEEALKVAREALGVMREVAALREAVGNTLGWEGNCLQDLGRFDEALARYDEAIAILEAAGDRRGVGNQRGNIANTLHRMGRHAEAVTLYEAALSIAEEVGNAQGVVNQLLGLSSAQASLFDWRGALQVAMRGRDLAAKLDDPRRAQFEEFILDVENAKRQFEDDVALPQAIFIHEGGIVEVERLTPDEVALVYRKALGIVQRLTSTIWESLDATPPFDPPIYCYVGFDAPNGWARKLGRRVVLGVSSGLVDNLMWWANTLLANPRTFPDLGRPEMETRYRFPPKASRNIDDRYWRPRTIEEVAAAETAKLAPQPSVPLAELLDLMDPDDLDDLLRNPDPPLGRHYQALKGDKRSHLYYEHLGWQAPFCGTRKTFAAYIATAGVCQAFLHELAHFFCGHLEVATEGLSATELAALEVEADVMALHASCGYDVCASLAAEFDDVTALVSEGTQQPDLPFYLWALGCILVDYMDLPFQDFDGGSARRAYLHPLERSALGLVALVASEELIPEQLYSSYYGAYGAALRTLGDVWSSKGIPGHENLPHGDKHEAEQLTRAYQHIIDASHAPVQQLLARTESRLSLGVAFTRTLRRRCQ